MLNVVTKGLEDKKVLEKPLARELGERKTTESRAHNWPMKL